jgi:hypothetical protein
MASKTRKTRKHSKRQTTFYRVIRPDGSEIVVSKGEFVSNVQAGNLVRDETRPHYARVPAWLSVKEEEGTGRLIFESRGKTGPAPTPVQISTLALLSIWLRSDPTITNQQARERMLVSLPRVLTETVCLY